MAAKKLDEIDIEDCKYPPTLEGKVQQLQDELNLFKQDNMYALFFALNKKSGEIAQALNQTELSLSGEDKVFDRVIKIFEKLEPMVKTLNSLRMDYLKLPEDEIEQASNNIPILERRASRKLNK